MKKTLALPFLVYLVLMSPIFLQSSEASNEGLGVSKRYISVLLIKL